MICSVKKIWRTIKYFLKTGDVNTIFSGCELTKHEVHENCTVYISYCERCKKPSIAWKHGSKASDNDKQIFGNDVCRHC